MCKVSAVLFTADFHSQVFTRATSTRVLAMATDTAREENGEFCVTVGPASRNVCILT